LQSHNISAAGIRASYQQRRAQAEAANVATEPASDAAAASVQVDAEADAASSQGETSQQRKRGRRPKKTKTKTKTKKRKRDEDSEDDEDLAIGQALNESNRPAPGQIDHCELCNKKFTVTPYSKAGPNGGLLCTSCSRNLDKGKEPEFKKPRVYQGMGRKRKVQSRIMDRTFRLGAKDLTTLCVETLAKNVDLAEDLGELPGHLVDKIARLLSKRRLVDPATVRLFLKPSTEELKIYDGAKLTSHDIKQCFGVCQKLTSFELRNGIMFKDEVMAYLQSRSLGLENFSLHGANLLTDKAWEGFFVKKGQHLRTLMVHFTDQFFGDDMIEVLGRQCPNLQRIALIHNQKITEKGVKALAKLPALNHVSLKLKNEIPNRAYRLFLEEMGNRLKVLSLREVSGADDDVLEAIHKSCRSLTKLRITESSQMTDDGFAELFTNWDNPSLEFIDFAKCRHLDASEPQNGECGVGLGDRGFRALMEHSGKALTYLNIESCRYISTEAFEEVFSANAEYPELRYLEIAFCEPVTDFVVGSIFRSCPKLHELVVIGCMRVTGQTRVPRGRLLIGVPNVMGMTIEGTAD
jgi:DNA repair protein RAD7